MDSTYFDIFVATLLLTFAMRGGSYGLLAESKAIIAIMVSIIFLADSSHFAREYLVSNFHFSKSTTLYVSYVMGLGGVYLFTLVLLHLYALFMGNFGVYDKIAGLLFSIAKILIVLSVLLYLIVTYINMSKSTKKFFTNSKSYPYLYPIGKYIAKEFRKRSDVSVDDVVENVVVGVKKLSDIKNLDKSSENTKREDDDLKDLDIDKDLMKEIKDAVLKDKGNKK